MTSGRDMLEGEQAIQSGAMTVLHSLLTEDNGDLAPLLSGELLESYGGFEPFGDALRAALSRHPVEEVSLAGKPELAADQSSGHIFVRIQGEDADMLDELRRFDFVADGERMLLTTDLPKLLES